MHPSLELQALAAIGVALAAGVLLWLVGRALDPQRRSPRSTVPTTQAP